MMEVKLTQYSHGAGCGCKISPQILSTIIGKHASLRNEFPALLVGNEHSDDAAVFDLGDGTAVISTTDFFMPIVDDPEIFGRIASVNAISDIYAMGGRPLLAIAILGWPVDKIPPEVAARVIDGARDACRSAGIPLAGGHSIDNPEPVFGLAVTGRVSTNALATNAGAREGDVLFLTKPLGTGIFSTAQKRGYLTEKHHVMMCNIMQTLNDIGAVVAENGWVHGMTDVTGFGLAGHLLGLCKASGVAAHLDFDRIPLIDPDAVREYVDKGAIPGGTHRNFSSYGANLGSLSDWQKHILCDPQTSGGLLIAGSLNKVAEIRNLLEDRGLYAEPIGVLARQTPGQPLLSL